MTTLPATAAHPGVTSPEHWRPRHHFTPSQHWINDPNGLVFVNGTWHLFYQYNPNGDQWGDISWGHAISLDLVQWQELPVALWHTADEMVFSGTVVVDSHNHSGLAPAGHAGPLLLAFYTGFNPHTKIQAQCLAWSADDGRSFTRYAGNPVLDIGSTEFRDPKVFWHAPTKRWVMLVVKALEQQVWVYTSSNLTAWQKVSSFGPAGSCDGNIWEMPDLFQLPVEGRPGERRWVLIVSVNHGSLWGGSGVQYFVGDFDGEVFTADGSTWWPLPGGAAPPPLAQRTQWADFGRDFYAPMSFNHAPDGRVLWLGWMSNWAYAKDLPTTPWRGQMSMARELSLAPIEGGGLRLLQRPAPEALAALPSRTVLDVSDVSAAQAGRLLTAPGLQGGTLRVQLLLDRAAVTSLVALAVLVSTHSTAHPLEQVLAGFDPRDDSGFIERQAHAGRFPGDGERHHGVRLGADRPLLSLDLWVDRCTLELFVDDGLLVISDLAFNEPSSLGLDLHCADAALPIRRLTVTRFDDTH